ncbi:MAG: hypothetical protein KA713_16940 [Chryseotalea sp. WA131a]|nr:MAG: hypothetical protein KA713_16940 [Chryseotalea sp. WA131a]
MNTNVLKELYWTVGIAVATGTIGMLLFNARLWDGQPVEIQLPEMYLVFSKLSVLIIIFLILLTSCYITRIIYYKLDNKILMGFLTFLLLSLLLYQFAYLEWINGFEYHIAPAVDKGDYFQKLDVLGFKEFRVLMWTLISANGIILTAVGLRFFKTKEIELTRMKTQ